MAANFGKLFGLNFKKNRPLKQVKNQGNLQGQSTDDSDEDGSYQDPTLNCATEPPGGGGRASFNRGLIPNYPPPRPNSPKLAQSKHDDYQDPWDSKDKTQSPRESVDDIYDNPFDQKIFPKQNTQTDYQDPFDAKCSELKKVNKLNEDDEYGEPMHDNPWANKILNEDKVADKLVKSQKVDIKTVRDDYTDPWDSKASSSLKRTEEYDDTYSEPYDDRQRDDAKQRSLNDDADDDDDFYEMPYKEKIAIGVAPPEQNGFKRAKQNSQLLPSIQKKQPRHPPPPSPGDYDAPWEWKVKNVEQEFEKQFAVSDNHPVAGTRSKSNCPSMYTHHTNNNINPVPKPIRSENPQPKVYEIDPTIPLENQGWFHGPIRRDDAEDLLRAQPDCSYLIRNSESSKLDYSLSLRNNGETMHLKISGRSGKYVLGGNSRPYDTIPEMIHQYSMNKLNIHDAEHVRLIYPVLQEAVYFTVEPGT